VAWTTLYATLVWLSSPIFVDRNSYGLSLVDLPCSQYRSESPLLQEALAQGPLPLTVPYRNVPTHELLLALIAG